MTASPTKPKSGTTLTLIAKENTMVAIQNLIIVGMPIIVMLVAMIIKGEW